MRLYDPNVADSYVWPMTAKNAKPGQPTTYQLTKEPSPKMWEERGYVMAGPCQVGMYDDEGFFRTYQSPVEGIRPGKYIRVLFGDALKTAKDDYESDRLYERYGGKKELAI
tara:strand:+ start:2321 stop:2653 length:333 start_codon:yes stop_codon:yes gene_type:complete